jgi:hypothetical protein
MLGETFKGHAYLPGTSYDTVRALTFGDRIVAFAACARYHIMRESATK